MSQKFCLSMKKKKKKKETNHGLRLRKTLETQHSLTRRRKDNVFGIEDTVTLENSHQL